MYCKRCGSELPKGAAFCPKCGMNLAENGASFNDSPSNPSSTTSTNKLRCPRCHSYNVKIQAIKQPPSKVKLYVCLGVLIGCMIGFCAAGFVGGIPLGLLGGIVSIVLYALVHKKYKSVGVCQDCGYSSEIK